jgi:hypothetical protein
MSARADGLRKREQNTRDVRINVGRAGDFVQVHISARQVDRWMKLTEPEALELAEGLLRELGQQP